MPGYTLSLNAAWNITEINKYAIENFCERQARRYMENFRDRFSVLVENLLLGIKRNDLKEGCYSFLKTLTQFFIRFSDGTSTLFTWLLSNVPNFVINGTNQKNMIYNVIQHHHRTEFYKFS